MSDSNADEIMDRVKTEIESNDVIIFSKTYCGYCTRTKNLFKETLGISNDINIKIYELNEMGDDGPAFNIALYKMTGQKSVPNVFVKGQHIGGNDDTQAAAKNGKLQELLGL